jgi:hypothetical protein
VEKAEGMAFRVARRAIAAGGTCSGEHGIGVHKIEHLDTEHGYGVEHHEADQDDAGPQRDHEPRQGLSGLRMRRLSGSGSPES